MNTDREIERNNLLIMLDPFRENHELLDKSVEELIQIRQERTSKFKQINHDEYDKFKNSIYVARDRKKNKNRASNFTVKELQLLEWENKLARREDEILKRERELADREKRLRSRSKSPNRNHLTAPTYSSPTFTSLQDNDYVRPADPIYKDQLLPSYDYYSPEGLLPNAPNQSYSFLDQMAEYTYRDDDEDEQLKLAIRESELEAIRKLDNAQMKNLEEERIREERIKEERIKEEKIKEEKIKEERIKEEERIREQERIKEEERIREQESKLKYRLPGRPDDVTDEFLDNLIEVIRNESTKKIRECLGKIAPTSTQWIFKLKHNNTTFRQYLLGDPEGMIKCITEPQIN